MGHVADGVDGGVAGARALIDHHAVFASQTGGARQGFARQSADADEDGVGGDQPAVGQTHAAVLEARDFGAGQDLDAVAAMQVGEEGREGCRRHAGQHPIHALDHHGLGAEGAGGSRRLKAHIAAADHGQPLAGGQGGLEPFGIV
ncbi:hypothetical protein D3C80_1415100 [compost metagenome]